MKDVSILQTLRQDYQPKLPAVYSRGASVAFSEADVALPAVSEDVRYFLPNSADLKLLEARTGSLAGAKALRVAVILSGGQAPGGHNVIAGLFDALKSLHPDSVLIGFLGGPSGLLDKKYVEIDAPLIDAYRNTGGFDIIGSGRTKLETAEQFARSLEVMHSLSLDGLVIIGGDDSNTNAAMLAEYLMEQGSDIRVVGAPKTIDGDLKNDLIETSFGFDTATKVYSELIGNIARDANSARKYWHFIKLMGRSASHIALECALSTQANITLISEEVAEKKMTLRQIISHVGDRIISRSQKEQNFGLLLIPEGLIEFIPEMKALISELNDVLAAESGSWESLVSSEDKRQFLKKHLSDESSDVYFSLPQHIAEQLVLDRDPHGNVQVSRIDTEKLLIEMTAAYIKTECPKCKFSALNHFFGYEGRCAAPSNFDADYGYGLGYTAAVLLGNGLSGYMACLKDLEKPASEWKALGVPIVSMMNLEKRHGELKPVIRKALVELDGAPMRAFMAQRDVWERETRYIYPGPIQYFGPEKLCDSKTKTLILEKEGK